MSQRSRRPWSLARYGLVALLLALGLMCLGIVFLRSQKAGKIGPPEDAIAAANLGTTFQQEGRMEEAIAQYQKALEIDPDQADVHSNLGVVFLEMGRVDDSIAHLQKALQITPNYADAHYNLGNSLLRVGRVEEALAHYKKTFEIDPSNVEARNNMAWVLATWPETRIRDGKKAVELAERADVLTDHVNPVISVTLAAA